MLYARWLLCAILVTFTSAFSIDATPKLARAVVRAPSKLVRMAEEEDVISSPLIKVINSLQEAIQQSPAAQFKKGLAKLQAGNYDEAAVKAELDSLINENRVIMFSFTTWPFCIKAKQVLDGYGTQYRVVELNEVSGGYALRAELAEITDRTSVPAVFIDGEFAGGCNDGGLGGIITLDREGKLESMLKPAPMNPLKQLQTLLS